MHKKIIVGVVGIVALAGIAALICHTVANQICFCTSLDTADDEE